MYWYVMYYFIILIFYIKYIIINIYGKYIKRLLRISSCILKSIIDLGASYLWIDSSKTWTLEEILCLNEANWNILVASGKEIKRDSISSVNENRQYLDYQF